MNIIITGTRDYLIPKEIWNEELEKIKERAKEREGEEWEIGIIYEASLLNTPLFVQAKALQKLADDPESEWNDRVKLIPMITDWLRYKKQAGFKRDQKMVEMGNILLSFTRTEKENSTGPQRFLIKAATKERLIIKKIFPEPIEETKEGIVERKEIKAGDLKLFDTLTNNNNTDQK